MNTNWLCQALQTVLNMSTFLLARTATVNHAVIDLELTYWPLGDVTFFNLISGLDILSIPCEITLKLMQKTLPDYKST